MEDSRSDIDLVDSSGVLIPSAVLPASFFLAPSDIFASPEAPAPERVADLAPSDPSDALDFCSSVSWPSPELSSGSDLAGGGRVGVDFEEAGL